jgi:hypothetical protein
MQMFFWLFFLFSLTTGYPYLENNNTKFNWIDIPTKSITQKNTYPYTGFGCTTYDNNNLYLISSTNPGRYQYNNQQYCGTSKKYVEILKYNFTNESFAEPTLIGQSNSEYPNAIGGAGSDNIVSCGIQNNILYYISSNIHNCPSHNNYDSSIVRLNSKTMQFIDRTILRNIPNIPSFSIHNHFKYKYLNIPTTSRLIEDNLWLSFGTFYTGILKLNIENTNIKLLDSFQKEYTRTDEHMSLMYGQDYSYDTIFREIKKSFVNRKDKLIYFLEDTGNSDSQIMIINYTLPMSSNNSDIIKLDGINYVSHIQYDDNSKKIYIISGSLSSEMYIYDLNFNKLQISDGCDIDFVKFPTDWGVVTNMQIDKQTGFIYLPISSRWGNNGIIDMNEKNLNINKNSLLKFGENIKINSEHNYFQWYNNMNITNIILDKGLLVVSSNHYSYRTKLAFVNLNGCAYGRGKNGSYCNKCVPGKFSNEIGGVCQKCHPGFSISVEESYECIKCIPGKYTNGDNAVNCINCPNGFFSNVEGSNYCEKCDKGKYSITTGSSNKEDCKKCPSGKISEEGSISCDFCTAGKWERKGEICELCQKGKYSFSIGLKESSECIQCPIGKYSDVEGIFFETDCKECMFGHIGIIKGASSNNSCFHCEKGKYRKSLKECALCPNGFVAGESQNECLQCPNGKVSDIYNIICLDCPKGKYGNEPGLYTLKSCRLCDVGRYSNYTNIKTKEECIKCPQGRFNNEMGATSLYNCDYCEPGKYRHNNDLLECIICERGKISSKGAVECLFCNEGMYVDVVDNLPLLCKTCPQGRYIDRKGGYLLESCIFCPRGKWNDEVGAIQLKQCKNCFPGKYSNTLASKTSTDCTNCVSGRFNPKNGSISIDDCILCPEGSISFDSAIQCSICNAGLYANIVDGINPSCEECPQGKFIDYRGGFLLESCINCPPGRWGDIIASSNISFCIECLKGKYSEMAGSIEILTCLDCESGRFNENSGANSINFCKPCSTGSMSLNGAFECISCEQGKYSELMSSSECKVCEEGKFTSEKNSISCNFCPDNSEVNIGRTACFCISGTYNNQLNGTECIECPDNFICEKGTTKENIVLKKNFWRESKETLNTYKCKNVYACKGGRFVNSTDNLCQPGHKGPICDVCEKGWSKDDGVCLKCPENIGRTISLTIVIPVICILIIIFLIKTANPANNKKEEVNGVVKIFMNYAQVFSLASSFQINWPTLVRYLFERAKEFSSPRVSFYSSDCAIGWGYYDKFIVYLALPIVYIIMATFIIFILSLCYCKKKKKKMKNMTDSQINVFKANNPTCLEFFTAWEKTAVVVGTFLSWPTIVEKTLEIMNCQKIGEKYYLVKDVSVVCYDSQHYIYLTIGYIGLILYGVGIPLLGFRLLYRYRFRLFDMQNRYDGSTPLSFLFLGYREKRWYYEFIIMGKKAGLILLSVFLRNYPRYQVIVASLLVQISFFLHVFLRPYDTITSYGMICNRLESVSLLALVMTLSTGLFFGTIDSGYDLGLFENVLIALLLFSNGALCLYFFVYFVHLTFKTAKTHFREFINEKLTDESTPCMFKCLSNKKIEYLKDWAGLEMVDDYGIHLENQVEKEIFTNYYKEKQSKLGILNSKIDSIKKRRVSVKLDKLRSEIQVMEKQRCWQTIQNNRLYAELKKVAMLNKSSLNEDELEKLNDVFKLYVEHGIQYNQKINGLYMQELHGMLPEKRKEYFINENLIIPRNIIIEVEAEQDEQILYL